MMPSNRVQILNTADSPIFASTRIACHIAFGTLEDLSSCLHSRLWDCPQGRAKSLVQALYLLILDAALKESQGCPLQPSGQPELLPAGRADHPLPLKSARGVCPQVSPQCCPGTGCLLPSWSSWCHQWSLQTCTTSIAFLKRC